MKKISGFLIVSLMLITPVLMGMGGKAEEPKAMAFGIVDTAKVFSESKLGQTGFGRLQGLQKKAESELTLLETRIDALPESDDDKMMRKQIEFQGALYTLQGLLDADQELVLKVIQDNFTLALSEVRTQKGMNMIFAKETVLSYHESADITQDVIKALDALAITFPAEPNITLPEPAVANATAPANNTKK